MMTDPAVKIALALCLLLAGVCAAALFRHGGARRTPASAAVEPLSIPYRGGKGDEASGRDMSPRRRRLAADGTSAPAAATVLTPAGRRQPPPPLPQEHVQPNRPPDSRWGRSMESMLPVATPNYAATHTHRIVDGDTLTTLAERYLGSASRAGEIFAANRDVLFDPKLLPIGIELKIPPRDRRP